MLEENSKLPMRAEGTRQANERRIKHLRAAFGATRLVDVTADSNDSTLANVFGRESLSRRSSAITSYKCLLIFMSLLSTNSTGEAFYDVPELDEKARAGRP